MSKKQELSERLWNKLISSVETFYKDSQLWVILKKEDFKQILKGCSKK